MNLFIKPINFEYIKGFYAFNYDTPSFYVGDFDFMTYPYFKGYEIENI